MWRYNEVTKISKYYTDNEVQYSILWPYCGSGVSSQTWVPDGPFWSVH